MIEIRCKACKRLALEVTDETTGRIKVRCKRASCGKWVEVILPQDPVQWSTGVRVVLAGVIQPQPRAAG